MAEPAPVRIVTPCPPRCFNCRGRVIPEHMQAVLDGRKALVFCGRACLVAWRARAGRQPEARSPAER